MSIGSLSRFRAAAAQFSRDLVASRAPGGGLALPILDPEGLDQGDGTGAGEIAR